MVSKTPQVADSTITLQAGKSKLVLSVTQVLHSSPDITEVGSSLEEAKALRHTHDELILKFNSKKSEALSAVSQSSNDVKKSVEVAWEDVFKRLESRKSLLDQSVSFHNSVQQFLKKLQQVEAKCVDVPLSQDVERARRDLQQHQELKKFDAYKHLITRYTAVLEASMMTLQEGQQLLDKIRKAALETSSGSGWSQQRHATTSGCYYIEQLLINLRFRKLRLDELWNQRRIQLEQCVKFMILKEDVAKITKWLEDVGLPFLSNSELGNSHDAALKLLRECQQVEEQANPFPQKLKHHLGSLDFIFSACPILAGDIDALKDVVQSLEGKFDNLLSQIDTRRRNLGLSASFYEHANNSTGRLEGLRLLRESLDNTTSATSGSTWIEGWKQLQRGLYDATVASLHDGHVLVNRVGRDDASVAASLAKLNSIEDSVSRLLANLPQALADEAGKDPTLNIDDKLYKLNSWLVLVGQASVNKFSRLTVNLHDVNEFLVHHRSLAEEVRAKQAEAKQLLTMANELVKPVTQKEGEEPKSDVTNQPASSLVERCEKLEKHFDNFRETLERRSKLALSFIVLQKRERQLSAQLQLLEEQLRSQVADSSVDDVTDATVRHRDNAVKKLTFDLGEFDKIGKQFVADAIEIKNRDSLSVEFVTNAVSLILANFEERKNIITNHFKGWKKYVEGLKDSKTKWKQLLIDGRKTIEWIIKVEDNFFPKLAGELGSSLAEVQQHQKRLEDFKHIIQKVQDETEQHLKSAELLSAKYEDNHGNRDFIVNELIKAHCRFQARIVEYKHLLDVAKKFFENLNQLDTLIDSTEKEYTGEQLPSNEPDAREALRSHHCNRNKLASLFEGRSLEADDIIVRVRQQDAQEIAKDEIRNILRQSELERSQWDLLWTDHKNKLEQGLLLCQFYFDLKQLQNELDLMQRQLDARQGCYGNTVASVQAIIQAFVQLKSLADVVGGRVTDFMATADKMIKDGHYDSRRIRHEVDETNRKWKHFYDSLSKFKLALDENITFYELHDKCEGWINEAGQFLLTISKKAPNCKTSEDVETLIKCIVQYRSEGGGQQDERLKNMEVVATNLYGSVLGPEKMSHILDKNQGMYNAFIKAIEELRVLQRNLVNTEHILANVEAVVEKKAPKQPKFVQPLQNAELAEGQRFTFECRLECDTLYPRIEWFRDDEPSKGFPTSYKDGLCQMTIEETLIADTAQYTCKCTTDAGTARTSANLKVKASQPKVVAPELLRHLKSADAPEGTSHIFDCHVTGVPFPEITWYKDEVPITSSNDYVITCEQGRCTLKVKKLSRDLHNAKFKFKAVNEGGEVVTSASLNVLTVRKPEFTKPLRDQAVDEGKSVKLECGYRGEPAPQIQWTFNDTPILPSALFKITITETTTSLEIKEIFSEDCGTYAVTAKNLGGEAQTTCLVALTTHETKAQILQQRTPEKPRFISPLVDGEAKEGDRARFECIVVGYPTPEITWFHNGKPIRQTKDFDFTFDIYNGKCVLLIHELYLEDTGVYLCQAKNEHGSDTTVAKLRVHPANEPPAASPVQVAPTAEVDEVPPKFTQLLKDIEGTEGELVRFECRVIGHPTPVIKWFFGRNQIETSKDFQISSEREVQILTIPCLHKHDAGNYMVKATNNAVESSHSVQTDAPVQAGHVPPEIIKSFHDIHVRPGQPCTIEVVIGGFPKPKIQWLFNNEPITNTVYRIATFGDVHSLHIPQVYDEDVGRFSVIAENDAAYMQLKHDTSNCLMIIFDIKSKNSMKHGCAGKAWCSALLVVVDSSQLVGEVDSPPETPQTGQRVMVSSYGPPPVVKPKRIPPPQVPAPLPDLPPKIFAGLRDLTSEIDKPLALEAIVEGRPEPLITWYKNVHEELSESPNYEISCREGRARLVILKPKLTDSGEYTCVAKNKLGQPRFLEKLQPSTTANEGHPVRLVVFTSGEPAPKIVWFKDSVEIKPSPDFVITDEGNKHTLLIPEAFPDDSGRYSVKVFNSCGEEFSDTVLTVNPAPKKALQVAPKFIKPLHNRSAHVDQRVILECIVPVELQPERVEWYHNELLLTPSNQLRMEFRPESGVCILIIEKVRPESRGRYICTIVVNGVSKSTTMDLEVILPPIKLEEKPHFTEHLRNQIADEGSEVQLTCQVKGQPRPIITWYHNGHLIRPSSRHAQRFNPADWTATLIIIAVNVNDAGIYTCSASNEVGQEYTSAEVKVRVKTPLPKYVAPPEPVETELFKSREIGGVAEQYFRPVFKKVPADLNVPEGHVARFDCVVLGRPTPDVYWFREGVRVFEDRMHKIVINEEGISSIIFEAVMLGDAGMYLCIARNRAGEDRFNVALNVLPRRSLAPPRFGCRLPNQTVQLGQPVTFTVDVEGIPQPTVTWEKNDQPITSGDRYKIVGDGYRSTLYIPFVTIDDNAWFQCVATSSGGTSVNKFRLTVEDDKKVAVRKSVSPGPQRSVSTGRPSPAPIQSSLIFSPTQQLLHSKRTTSETTLKTVHTDFSGRIKFKSPENKLNNTIQMEGTMKSPIEAVAAPKLIEPMKDQLLNDGGTAHFRCRIHSPAATTHQWYYENSPLSHNWNVKYRTFEEADGLYGLDIHDVTELDAGIYKCVVENKGGEVTCIAHLRVGVQPTSKITTRVHATPSPVPFIQAPHIVRPMVDSEAELGGPATFEVIFSGPPMSKVEWVLNGRKVSEHDNNFKIHQTSNTASLRIERVHEGLSGKVQCLASNDNGSVESTATLRIRGARSPFMHNQQEQYQQQTYSVSTSSARLSKSPLPSSSSSSSHNPQFLAAPQIVKHLENVIAKDGSQVILSCCYKAQEPVSISWFHNDRNIDSSPDYAINNDRSLGKSDLVIVDCMPDDAGIFKCVVRNNLGQAETVNKLQVEPQDQSHHNFSTMFVVRDNKPSSTNASEEMIKAESVKVVGAAKNQPSALASEGVIIPRYSPRYYDDSTHEPHQPQQVHQSASTDNNGSPIFIQPIQPCVIVEGETLNFTAHVHGYPEPKVEWFKDKQVVYPDSRHAVTAEKSTGKYSLRVFGCSQLFDAGVYSCQVSNLNGKATCSANAVVVRK
ncbi:hypothetical protein HELRODRAFT_191066 [Helobdella robusta]|uniref:Ig-like domain-containing protein n=1 Tax=Helobdella robusta TaxID=6412 RepID=T1FSK0_HELRO|nr:hypothetical protein HELRODRAFT_191066 [Helobdella robusta]ESO07120.1 hypothetical protein HELRODRAFT_191066 [Helobdella robusta]